MRDVSLWRGVFGLEMAVIERVEFDEDDRVLVAHVRPAARQRGRCGICRRRCRGYDGGTGRRRWRSLDLGTTRAALEADAPRVSCPTHGVVVAHVPWARHGAGHTHDFDAQVAWLVTQCSKSAVAQLMRISWRTVGSIISRVWNETAARVDRFAGLRRIGIDEISYKRGHKYLTVVVDHDTGRLVWAAPGRNETTVHQFFDELAASSVWEDRCAAITHVSADGAGWISRVVTARCPTAVRCADPFHVVSWAGEAMEVERRDAWRTAREAVGGSRRIGLAHGRPARESIGDARILRRARWALLRNPENLTTAQREKLEWVVKANPRLHRAYLLKEGLRLIFALPSNEAPAALEQWLAWAARSRIDSFVALGRRIRRHRTSILAAIEHGLSNGRIESVNTKIRLITRRAFGFASPEPLIALAMLELGGHRPALPGRT